MRNPNLAHILVNFMRNPDWRISLLYFHALFHHVKNNFYCVLLIYLAIGITISYYMQAREADMSHWVEGAPLSLDCEDMPAHATS